MYGHVMSDSGARTTIAVTHSATVTSRLLRPACGAREEDDAVGRARDLVEGADQLRLATAALVHHRHRRPHALVELAAELLHKALGVLGDIEIAFGDQLLAMPRTHAQELHPWRLWQRAGACSGTTEWGARTLAEREHIDGPGARAEGPYAVAHGLA